VWRFFIVDWIDMEKEKMTLRDQFAMAALSGLLACDETAGDKNTLATWSYDMADEMLKAREVDNEN
jgi:hypothetical protein